MSHYTLFIIGWFPSKEWLSSWTVVLSVIKIWSVIMFACTRHSASMFWHHSLSWKLWFAGLPTATFQYPVKCRYVNWNFVREFSHSNGSKSTSRAWTDAYRSGTPVIPETPSVFNTPACSGGNAILLCLRSGYRGHLSESEINQRAKRHPALRKHSHALAGNGSNKPGFVPEMLNWTVNTKCA